MDLEPKLSLAYVEVQNLRGFREARLRMDSDVLFLVGPNNSGKTSVLRLLDVALNWDLDAEFRRVGDRLLDELLPARDTRNAARRLTLGIEVSDGRRHKALRCSGGVAELRLSLTIHDRRLRANLGPARRGEQHDEKAARLLSELRDEHAFLHVPAGRSADSADFTSGLLAAVTKALVEKLQQPGKGATKAERDAKKVVESLAQIAGPVEEFWSDFLKRLPHGWVAGSSATPAIDREVLAKFVVEQLAVRLTTGDHDADGVEPVEVGTGLQSLLDLELRRLAAEASGRRLTLAVEEPEVFLHPSAQRHLGRTLASGALAFRTVVSTHSPLIVEEATFDQVAIVRGHSISQPDGVDAQRALINGSLATGRGAEVLFSRSVLLVEGPGDRNYFEALRRRLASHDPRGVVDHCYVLDVGANSRFAPSVRLLRSYAGHPFAWMALMDSDSSKELREAVNHAGLRLSPRQTAALAALDAARATKDLGAAEKAARDFARFLDDLPVALAPGDLEHMMCSGLSDSSSSAICTSLGIPACEPSRLGERLGTKHRPSFKSKDDAIKAPWMREVIGRETPASELDPLIDVLLERWLTGASENRSYSREIVRKFRASG